MIGIAVNVLAVVIGGLIGSGLGSRIPEAFMEKIKLAFSVCAVGMGVASIVMMKNMPAVILSVVVGTVLGLIFGLDVLIRRGGTGLQRLAARVIPRPQKKDLSEEVFDMQLLTVIVLFCSSATGIYGSLNAGMTGNVAILLSKSVLDFFTAMIFATKLGPVISAVAIPQLAVFSLMFVLARLILPVTTPMMIADFKACGGILLIATGLCIAGIKEFPIANMLPAMVLVIPFSWAWATYLMPLL
ncbi:DUF554 domain-containing protein [Pseudoramibacter alactolyticus]|uniref:DUF554 domain-containing protein n=1 Tax=Pseudoramibacter alactolyticus TaxID=113287 RepID=UPI00248ED9D6|nr:DUF554 domain-containing protein [Pseudoramibacter alactolyticus]